MKFTFTAEDDDGYKNELTFNEEVWTETLQLYLDYLRGCGFVIDAHADLDLVMSNRVTHSDEPPDYE